MKKQFFNISVVLAVLLTLLGANVQAAKAGDYDAPALTLLNPTAIIPTPPNGVVKYTQGPHLSGFKMGYITNPGQAKSSIDLGYSGLVTAPISGNIMIAKSCADGQQIVFVNAKRGADGNGWSIGLVHVHVSSGIKEGALVVQGQVIGSTVLPPTTDDHQGCGYGSGMHIHYTLMKYKVGSKGPLFTEQNIGNAYLAQWIVKDAYLGGPRNDVPLGGKIEDVVKITATNDGGNIIEGQPTGIVRTMFFVPGNVKQTWNRIAAGDGYYFFRNRQYGNCMTVTGGSMLNGAKITLAACGNNAYQEFRSVAIPGTSGVSALQARHSGKVIDIPTAAGTATGIQVQQWQALYGVNQQWTVSKP